MSAPVCVITYRHPARIALRLGHHWYKGAYAKLDAGESLKAAASVIRGDGQPRCGVAGFVVWRKAPAHTSILHSRETCSQACHRLPHTHTQRLAPYPSIADAWLSIWEQMMTGALKTCRGKPTVIVQARGSRMTVVAGLNTEQGPLRRGRACFLAHQMGWMRAFGAG